MKSIKQTKEMKLNVLGTVIEAAGTQEKMCSSSKMTPNLAKSLIKHKLYKFTKKNRH